MSTRRHPSVLSPLAGALVVAAVGACSSSGSNSPPRDTSDPDEVVLVDDVTTFDASSADDVTVLPDRLLMPMSTHPEIEKAKAGDILVGDRGSSPDSPNRTGFLRRIVSVDEDGDDYVVTTEMATLTEVIRKGEFNVVASTADATDIRPTVSTRSFGPGLRTQGKSIELVDISGTTLIDETQSVTLPGTQKTIGYQVWAKVATGKIEFKPDFDVGAKIEPDLSNLLGSVKEAHVIGEGQLDGELLLDVGLELQSNATGEDIAQLIANRITGSADNVLAQYDFSLGSGKVGPIPIPVNGQFKASVICDFKWGGGVQVLAGGKASAQVKAGFRYQDGAFSPVWDHSESLDQLGPDWTINGDVMLKCTLRPEFHINLFDIAAGDVWADAYAAMRAQAICNQGALTGDLQGEAFAGVSATAHAKVDVFGLFKWEKTCSLFDIESPRATVNASWPLGPGATCTEGSATEFASTAHEEPDESCFGSSGGSGGSGGTSGSGGTGGSGGDAGTAGAAGTGGDADAGAPDANPEGGDACPGTTEPVSYKWTCEPERWGDCICDCDCGTEDVDCQTGECGGCDHDVCTEGGPLGINCDKDNQGGACIQAICENDSYCCEHAWTLSCIAHVENGDFGCVPQSCQ